MTISKDFVAVCETDYLDSAPTLAELLASLDGMVEPGEDVAIWQGPRLVAVLQGEGGLVILNVGPAQAVYLLPPEFFFQFSTPPALSGMCPPQPRGCGGLFDQAGRCQAAAPNVPADRGRT